MSRIHEALKRAEQERAAALEGRGDVAPPDPVAPDPLASVIAANAIANLSEPKAARTAVAPPPSAPPNFQATLDWDMVLARSSQAPWNPDSKTMLFFNQDENARGTEQFRTLRSRLYHMREKLPLKKVLVTSALPTHHPNRVTLHPAHDLGIAVKFSEERIHRPVGQ